MKRNRSPETEASFQEKRRRFKQASSSKFHQYLSGLVDDLKTNPKRFWTFLKCQKGKHSAMSHLIDGNRKVTDDAEKAELLNRVFAAKFTNPDVTAFPPAPDYPLDILNTFEVCEGTVMSILRSVSPHKACGPDNVSARVIHECYDELTVPVTKLCRLSVSQGTFPSIWKRANIVSIFKKGSKALPTNYRSVSLLPLLSKVLERVVYVSLFNHVRPALSDKQHGFIPGRSCVSNLATMLENAWGNISAGSQTDVIYTDYSSAFQSVNHALLIHKLKNSYHISGKALDWCRSYLSGREQRVVLNGQCSTWVPVPSGTPEGGILSPLMFACFINDLPMTLSAATLMFADDVKIYHRVDDQADASLVQDNLNYLYQWSELWGLKLNPSKCKVLTLTLRRSPIHANYTIGGTAIERLTVMRDLGVLIDEKLTFEAHIDSIVSKANRAMGLMFRSFQTGRRGRPMHQCNSRAMLSTYYANVRSVLEYCCVVWGGAADSHLQRLEKIQHKFLVWLCGRCHFQNIAFDYKSLLSHFGVASLEARRKLYDLMFIRNIHKNTIDSSFLLNKFALAVPPRMLRGRVLFHVPYARVNTVKRGIFTRIPKLCNMFLDTCREADVWHLSKAEFKAHVLRFVSNVRRL